VVGGMAGSTFGHVGAGIWGGKRILYPTGAGRISPLDCYGLRAPDVGAGASGSASGIMAFGRCLETTLSSEVL